MRSFCKSFSRSRVISVLTCWKGFYYYNLICTKVAHVLLFNFSITEKNYKLPKWDSKIKTHQIFWKGIVVGHDTESWHRICFEIEKDTQNAMKNCRISSNKQDSSRTWRWNWHCGTTKYVHIKTFAVLTKHDWGRWTVISQNNEKKKNVAWHRTWVSKRTVQASIQLQLAKKYRFAIILNGCLGALLCQEFSRHIPGNTSACIDMAVP